MKLATKKMGRPLLPRHTEIGKRLTAIRERLDLTQAEVAEKLGVSMWSVLSWERGIREPDSRSLKLIDLLERGKI